MLTYCEADRRIALNKDGSRWSRENGTDYSSPKGRMLCWEGKEINGKLPNKKNG